MELISSNTLPNFLVNVLHKHAGFGASKFRVSVIFKIFSKNLKFVILQYRDSGMLVLHIWLPLTFVVFKVTFGSFGAPLRFFIKEHFRNSNPVTVMIFVFNKHVTDLACDSPHQIALLDFFL